MPDRRDSAQASEAPTLTLTSGEPRPAERRTSEWQQRGIARWVPCAMSHGSAWYSSRSGCLKSALGLAHTECVGRRAAVDSPGPGRGRGWKGLHCGDAIPIATERDACASGTCGLHFGSQVSPAICSFFSTILYHALPLKRSLKMKSARFEKASEEIGVPREKKSERYSSTAHGQTDRHDLLPLRALRYLLVPQAHENRCKSMIWVYCHGAGYGTL